MHCIDAQISLASSHPPKPSMWTPIAFFAISIKGWELRFLFESSGRQVEKVAQLPELLYSPLGSRRLIRPPSTAPQKPWRKPASSCIKWASTATASIIRRR